MATRYSLAWRFVHGWATAIRNLTMLTPKSKYVTMAHSLSASAGGNVVLQRTGVLKLETGGQSKAGPTCSLPKQRQSLRRRERCSIRSFVSVESELTSQLTWPSIWVVRTRNKSVKILAMQSHLNPKALAVPYRTALVREQRLTTQLKRDSYARSTRDDCRQVQPGEPSSLLRNHLTDQLTSGAENSTAGRWAFSACVRRV